MGSGWKGWVGRGTHAVKRACETGRVSGLLIFFFPPKVKRPKTEVSTFKSFRVAYTYDHRPAGAGDCASSLHLLPSFSNFLTSTSKPSQFSLYCIWLIRTFFLFNKEKCNFISYFFYFNWTIVSKMKIKNTKHK